MAVFEDVYVRSRPSDVSLGDSALDIGNYRTRRVKKKFDGDAPVGSDCSLTNKARSRSVRPYPTDEHLHSLGLLQGWRAPAIMQVQPNVNRKLILLQRWVESDIFNGEIWPLTNPQGLLGISSRLINGFLGIIRRPLEFLDRFLGFISNYRDAFREIISRTGDTGCSASNRLNMGRLLAGGCGQGMRILSPRPHFEPLKADEGGSGRDYDETSPCPPESRTLKTAHAFFYFFEISFGCWLGWDGVFWLGFCDRRRAYRGILSVLGAVVFVCHGSISVAQKYLTRNDLCSTVMSMANILSTDKQIAIISALAEGSSIRSIERMTGIHRDTIMRLGVRVGKGCEMLLDSKMQDLGCNYLQLDEVWGYIGKKERHCSVDDNPEYGDVWTFCAIDSETKLVPSFKCGKRTHELANEFIQDIAGRIRNRVQISTDAMHSYPEAIERAFGADVDYGQIVKVYVHDAAQHPERKYSAPSFASAYRRAVAGNPEMELVSTSHVERLNATTRLHVKRLNRLTLAFSKKFENFKAAVALHFAYYNLVRRHNTLRCTPAMAAGVEKDFWTVGQLVEAAS